MRLVRPLSALALIAAIVGTSPARGQPADPRPAVSLAAGVSQYDLSGTGTAPLAALRADWPLRRPLLVEAGLAVARPAQQFGAHSTLFLPEVGVQLQLPRRVAPYVGLGAGGSYDFHHDTDLRTDRDWTFSGAAGVRAWAGERLGVRGELRVRGIGTGFEGSAAEWTLGVAWRL